jgi:hypothetical protein
VKNWRLMKQQKSPLNKKEKEKNEAAKIALAQIY